MTAARFPGPIIQGDPLTPTQWASYGSSLLTNAVFRYREGRWARSQVGCRLPVERTYFRTGTPYRSAVQALPKAAAIVRRIVPWATIYAGPDLWTAGPDDGDRELKGWHVDGDGRLHQSLAGQAYPGQGHCFLSLNVSAHVLLATAVHEAFHLISPELSGWAKGTIDAATSNGLTSGSTWLDDPEEKRARLFEAWSMTFLEGAPSRPITSDLDQLFEWIWSGDLGSHVGAQRRVATA